MSGVLVTFAPAMSEPANRAALAFRAAVDAQEWPEVSETSTSLVSVFLEVDLAATPHEPLFERLQELLGSRDWYSEALPKGRTLWHVPTVYGTDLAPQLEEAVDEYIEPINAHPATWRSTPPRSSGRPARACGRHPRPEAQRPR